MPSGLMRQVGELLQAAEVSFLSTWIRQGIALTNFEQLNGFKKYVERNSYGRIV